MYPVLSFPSIYSRKKGMIKTVTFKEKLLHLHEAPFIHWKRLQSFYQADPSLTIPFQWNASDLSSFLQISSSQASLLHRYLQTHSPTGKLAGYKKLGIHIITPFDKAYPDRLTHIYDPPWVLYTKGNLSLFHSPLSLSVVGTRTPTQYGEKALHHLLPPLINKKVTIVSGLARGTDTLAHRIALGHKGATIAVLGSGFQHIYPRENYPVASEIAKQNLLISEYSPAVPPRKWQFPMRNRIISALSDITFLSEAGERSGSLITAYQALEQGKEVRVLPGSIFSTMSKGTNQLLAEGAAPVLSSNDLWHERW
ncbi:DNA-processing protein DprA [Alteribacillus sp. JSM 102045]|uniref:DNA-processing protein DprA n=1 Tax=Alteribacillus sp. JSM 102045 TaxID=1562101 RepID=UPI0035C1E268